jgi:hypothetical protein
VSGCEDRQLRRALLRGPDADGLSSLVAQLVGAGVATQCPQSRGRATSIRIHGRGPLSELLVGALRCSGARIAHSSQPHATVSHHTVDPVVLTDYLIADPRLLRDVHSQRVAHLPVRVRDGTGLVGPLVIPGVTSCLVDPCREIPIGTTGTRSPWSALNSSSCRPRRSPRGNCPVVITDR